MKKIWIYMIGVAPFAFFYGWFKSLASGPIFLLFVIAYLLLIRLLAEKFGK